ncbi:Cytolysin-3, partial [Stylophora pistillata]
EHQDVCQRFPIHWSNNCGLKEIPREKLVDHIQDACALTEVHCEYNSLGSGTLISAAHLNSVILQTIVDNIAWVNRKIAIGVINETPSSWTAQCPFFKSGTSDAVLPEFVKSGEAALYSARRRHTSFLVGAVGMFIYYMPDAERP